MIAIADRCVVKRSFQAFQRWPIDAESDSGSKCERGGKSRRLEAIFKKGYSQYNLPRRHVLYSRVLICRYLFSIALTPTLINQLLTQD